MSTPTAAGSLFRLSILATALIEPHRFVGFDGAHAGAGEAALGVSDNLGIANGESKSIHRGGEVLVEAGGVLAVGDPVVSDANGKAIKASDLTVNSGAATASAVDATTPTLAGSVTPEVILGYARDIGADTKLVRVVLV